MQKRFVPLLAVAAFAAAGALTATGTPEAGAKPDRKLVASAVLRDTSANVLGRIWFFRKGEVVEAVAAAAYLTPGFHGFHVHAVGVCDPAGAFASAGGHHNPTGAAHGRHAGDMPPLLAGGDGVAWASFRGDRFAEVELFDADGSAVVIHAGPDNLGHVPSRYRTDAGPAPDAATLATGDAGARVACGVIRRATG